MTTKVKVPTKAEFREYLQGLTEKNVIKFCRSGNCPIAQYIADNNDFPKGTDIGVDDIHIEVFTPDAAWYEPYFRKDTPRWASAFIVNVDYLADRKNAKHKDTDGKWSGITSAEALFALDFPATLEAPRQ